MKSKRMTIVDEDGLQIDLEYNEYFFILHLPIFRATKGNFKHLQFKVEELYEFAVTIGFDAVYAAVEAENKTIKKLLKMLSFKKQGQAEGFDVYKYTGET